MAGLHETKASDKYSQHTYIFPIPNAMKMTYDLPPSSRVTPVRCSEAAFMTILPTMGLPV